MNNSVEGIFNILDAEPVKNLFSPITKEIGEALGDFGSIIRFYSHRNLEAIFTKWAELRRAPIVINDFEKAMPLLLLAASVTDEELQDRWATLLESAVTTKKGFLPSFGRVLSELTPEEARYLDRLREAASIRCRFAPDGVDITRKPFSHFDLVKIFDSYINTEPHSIQWEVPGIKVTENEVVNAHKIAYAELIIRDFERLGILTQRLVESRTSYSLSEYGLHFIIAVTPLSVWKAFASGASAAS